MKSINFYEVKKISLFLVGSKLYSCRGLNYYLVEFIDISVLISFISAYITGTQIFFKLKYGF